jgi:hypothetical protein
MTKLTMDNLELPWNLYYKALELLYDRISKGEKLVYYDDATIGDKELHCSWGLCSNQAVQWPDPEMHLWPEAFVKNGRVSPKYKKYGQRCPNDRRAFEKPHDDYHKFSGCFFSCMIFSPDGKPLPSRDQVIAHTLFLMKERTDNE